MTSSDAVDLGFGETEDVVNGAGQIAFVDRTEATFSEYSNEAQLDNSGVLHNRRAPGFATTV
jgi:hypothetical protein